MNRKPRILVAATQSPFLAGGAERHVERLVEELRARKCEVEKVAIPLFEKEHFDLVRTALMWRLPDFSGFPGRPVDALIATRFPSYLARHPRKVVWLIHQYRQAYDQYGTPYSDFTASAEDQNIRAMIQRMDAVGLTEARRVFANSRNVAERLRHHNAISSEPLYHPPPLLGRYHEGAPGDYALWVGRLEGWKRPGLAVEALAHAPAARLKIVGEGPELSALTQAARSLGVMDRCEFAGRVSDEELLDLYAGARMVLVTAAGEDYGYVTLEAFLSGKAVLTVSDAGGPLEFVYDGKTGIVTAPQPQAFGYAIEKCWGRERELSAMGRRGRGVAQQITWDHVVETLLAGAGL